MLRSWYYFNSEIRETVSILFLSTEKLVIVEDPMYFNIVFMLILRPKREALVLSSTSGISARRIENII